MANEEKEKKKGMKNPYSLPVVQAMGTMSRSDPELWEAFQEYVEKEGIKPTEGLITIVKKYFLMQKVQVSQISMEQLLVAWDILKEMMKYSTYIYTSLATLFFSELTGAMGTLIDEKVKERLELMKPKSMDDRLRERMLQLFEPMLEAIMGYAFKISKLPVPESLKPKIPVQVKVKESGKEEETGGKT
jgi:hypothetical protein